MKLKEKKNQHWNEERNCDDKEEKDENSRRNMMDLHLAPRRSDGKTRVERKERERQRKRMRALGQQSAR